VQGVRQGVLICLLGPPSLFCSAPGHHDQPAASLPPSLPPSLFPSSTCSTPTYLTLRRTTTPSMQTLSNFTGTLLIRLREGRCCAPRSTLHNAMPLALTAVAIAFTRCVGRPFRCPGADCLLTRCLVAYHCYYIIHVQALAVACGKLDPNYIPKLGQTSPVFQIGPHPSWGDPTKIATMDPWGHIVTQAFSQYFEKGYDIRPTIAVTKAHIDLPEIKEAIRVGRLKPDGKILTDGGQAFISKVIT
jgi:hypothetical protein